ncbi:MAG: hypothetical protein NZ739_01420 [Verrucomicrobiae bacterium]|nr:hypothetical protein [Verrucomicrobiae bacterium]MDW7979273.1 hypothetical protein [Verrucomicrobiales bacterium]
MGPELLKILCCPETHQPVRLAEPGLIAELNRQIAAGTLRNRAGQPVAERIDGGLVRADGKFLYPIRNGIPVMLVAEAIPLPQAADHASAGTGSA